MSRQQDGINIYRTIKNSDISNQEIEQIIGIVARKLKRQPVIAIQLIGDKRMRRLNREYRKKDKTTDVLSFSMSETHPLPSPFDDWGDIFISIPQIRRQAKQCGRPYREEFTRMLVHGILHLAGYDHEKTSDSAVMIPLQERLVKRIMRDGKLT